MERYKHSAAIAATAKKKVEAAMEGHVARLTPLVRSGQVWGQPAVSARGRMRARKLAR